MSFAPASPPPACLLVVILIKNLEDAPDHARSAGRGFHPQVSLHGLLSPTLPMIAVGDASDLPIVRVPLTFSYHWA